MFIVGHAKQVQQVKGAIEGAHQDTVTMLQRELKELKKINQELQQKYQVKQQECKERVGTVQLQTNCVAALSSSMSWGKLFIIDAKVFQRVLANQN